GDALRVIKEMHREAAEFVKYDVHHDGQVPEAGRMTRIDLVRDFHDVDEISRMLRGLQTVPVPGRAKGRVHFDASRNHAETLTFGPKKAWQSRLYDKHTETAGLAPPGQLRF